MSSHQELNIATKTVLFCVLPLTLSVVVVVSLLWLYHQRSHRFLSQPLQHCADDALSPTPLLLGHSTDLPTSHFDLKLVEVKARGRFGAVWKGELPSGELVAVKVFPAHDRQSWLCEQRFYALLRTTNSANILQFIGAESRDAELWLVTEYHDSGSLYNYLKARTVSLSQLTNIALSVTNGLAFLHSDVNGKPPVAHRDIKSRNVLLRLDMTACIADFGLALMLDTQPRDALPQVNIYCLPLHC